MYQTVKGFRECYLKGPNPYRAELQPLTDGVHLPLQNGGVRVPDNVVVHERVAHDGEPPRGSRPGVDVAQVLWGSIALGFSCYRMNTVRSYMLKEMYR